MKYLVIGAGGTGGGIGAYMARARKPVTLIARGKHLEALQSRGLRLESTAGDAPQTIPVRAFSMETYPEGEHPDVIFVCVKGYSLDSVYPFISRIAKPETVVIPVLNIYGTGGRMQEKLPGLLVTDGCIYIAAEIREPGVILMKGSIFRVVFGTRKPEEMRPVLKTIQQDLENSGITGILSDNIQRDALQKFSYVSPAAACGLYYDVSAGAMQKPGEIRDTFALLVHEIDCLAYAQGIRFKQDIVQNNLDILDHLTPDASTSMQRDIWAGKQSEIDGLIFEVIRTANKLGLRLPTYRKIGEELRKRGF